MLRFIGAAATVTRHAEFLVCHQDGDFFPWIAGKTVGI